MCVARSSTSNTRWIAEAFAALALLLAASTTGCRDASALNGAYANERLQVEFECDGSEAVGAVVIEGVRYPLRGTVQGGEFVGTFRAAGVIYPLRAERRGDSLIVAAGKREHVLHVRALSPDAPAAASDTTVSSTGRGASAGDASRRTPDDDSASPPPSRAAIGASTDKAVAQALSEIHSHPVGFDFSSPPGWRVRKLDEQTMKLLPPVVSTEDDGVTEVFLVLGDTADGITEPCDPRLVGVAEQVVKALFPTLSRDGPLEKRSSSGRRDALVSWSGTLADEHDYRARMWMTVFEGNAIGVLAATRTVDFEKRVAIMESVFSSFREPSRAAGGG